MSDEKTLAEWLASGRRFTEEEATLIALDLAVELDEAHQGGAVQHPKLRLGDVYWSPGRARARLSGLRMDCGRFQEDARPLGQLLTAVLGAPAPEKRSDLAISPAFAMVLDRLLHESSSRRHPSAASLRRELGGSLAGTMPARSLWQSRTLQGRLVALLACVALGWSLYCDLTGPNRVLRFDETVGDIAFSADGRRFAASVGKSVRVWDTDIWHAQELSLPVLPNARYEFAGTLAFSPDGSRLAVARAAFEDPWWRGTLLLWDIRSAAPVWTGEHQGTITSLAFSPDGKQIAAGANRERHGVKDAPTPGEIVICDAGTGAVQGRVRSGDNAFPWVGWTADGRLQYRMRLWSSAARAFGQTVLGERSAGSGGVEVVLARDSPEALGAVARSPDGGRFASADSGTELIHIFGARGERIVELNTDIYGFDYRYGAFTPGAFSPDGRYFAATFSRMGGGRTRRSVRLWDAKDWSLKREKPLRGGWGLKNPVAWEVAMSRHWLAATYGNSFETEIHLWNIAR